jgi:hypothetical protein
VARLIYVFLALALGTLVAGFLVRDSSIPLLVSIGLSALVLLLILVGTSRRLRQTVALEDEQVELASLEIVEIDEADVVAPEATVEVQAPKPRQARRRRSAAAEDTQAMEAVADAPDPAGAVEPDETEVVVAPKRSRRAKPARRAVAAKPKPPRRRAGTIVEPQPEIEPDAFPEFEVETDEEPAEEPDGGAAAETVADAEPPLTIDTPSSREPARPRRRASRAATAARPGARTEAGAAAGAERTAATERPVLSPKVWVIPGRSRYHTQDCRFAKGDTLREVTEATAQRRGYVACTVCKPGSA